MNSIEAPSTFSERNGASRQLTDQRALGVCCCCLELAWKQCLWEPCIWMDRQEVYGKMLQECFAIMFPDEKNKRVRICKLCIVQLRSALNFKRQVLTCQKLLLNTDVEIQKETNCCNITSMAKDGEAAVDDGYENNDIMSTVTVVGTDDVGSPTKKKPRNIIPNGVEKELKSKQNGTKLTKQNSYNKENDENKNNVNSNKSNSHTDTVMKKFRCIIRSGKSVFMKGRNKRGHKRHFNYLRPRLNICILLENSTLVPFKADKGCFFCYYCAKEFALFNELKQHTTTSHANLSSKDIINRLHKPERVRADASDINCKICHKKLDTVGDLVEHLVKRHNIQFSDHVRQPVDCVIPYDLSDSKNRCSICRKEFLFFKSLSKHMNEHTTNYVCAMCGKCFLLPERLQNHKKAHKAGPPVECEQCGKKIRNDFLLKTHIRNVHNKSMYGCTVCNLKFCSFRERLAHLDKTHGIKMINLKCSQCEKTFKLPQTLRAHMRHTHMNIRKTGNYPCNICFTVFSRRSSLKTHMLVHTKEKNFECRVCHKKFGRNSTLLGHLRIHNDDRRWACRDCGAAFVQKCSLHAHIKVHHKGADVCQLVVCRKRPDING